MVVPVLIVGSGIIPLSLYGRLAVGIIILGGGYAIWWGTERAWGKFSIGTLAVANYRPKDVRF
jgi:hypothetical protein